MTDFDDAVSARAWGWKMFNGPVEGDDHGYVVLSIDPNTGQHDVGRRRPMPLRDARIQLARVNATRLEMPPAVAAVYAPTVYAIAKLVIIDPEAPPAAATDGAGL